MPQLVKGGKHAYGWTRVAQAGLILLPPEAVEEYGFEDTMKLIILPGSRKSGGFSVGHRDSFSRTPLATVLQSHQDLAKFQLPEGALVDHHGKPYSWTTLRAGTIRVPQETLQHYGVHIGDKLLVIRGSSLALGFAVRGPIINEAKRHPELVVFEADE